MTISDELTDEKKVSDELVNDNEVSDDLIDEKPTPPESPPIQPSVDTSGILSGWRPSAVQTKLASNRIAKQLTDPTP